MHRRQNDTTLKKSTKKQGHIKTDCSGAYSKENISARHIPAATAMEDSISPDTFLPQIQVNIWCVFLLYELSGELWKASKGMLKHTQFPREFLLI